MSKILTESDHGLVRVILNDPDRRNVLSFEFVEELNVALDAVVPDPSARVALLCANGPAFCAGMDLKTVALDNPDHALRFGAALADAYRKLLRFPLPLLAAVDGPAMGGAVGLALSADLIWVGPGAKFAFPETRVGVVPALVSVAARRRMTPGKLAGMALAGIEADAPQAARIGLAEFASPESAVKDAEAFARKLMRENSGEAMRRTKAFLQSQFLGDLEKQLADALAEFQQAVATDACKRGLAAFRERKAPDWSG